MIQIRHAVGDTIMSFAEFHVIVVPAELLVFLRPRQEIGFGEKESNGRNCETLAMSLSDTSG